MTDARTKAQKRLNQILVMSKYLRGQAEKLEEEIDELKDAAAEILRKFPTLSLRGYK